MCYQCHSATPVITNTGAFDIVTNAGLSGICCVTDGTVHNAGTFSSAAILEGAPIATVPGARGLAVSGGRLYVTSGQRYADPPPTMT